MCFVPVTITRIDNPKCILPLLLENSVYYNTSDFTDFLRLFCWIMDIANNLYVLNYHKLALFEL